MDTYADLHICGKCKRNFSDIKLFYTHKSECLLPQNTPSPPITPNIQLENALFANQTLLDLNVLDNESLAFDSFYGNEEVVSDNPLQSQENNSTQDQLNQIITSNKIINNINEEDVATLLVTQLPKEVINKKTKRKQSHGRTTNKGSESINFPEQSAVEIQPSKEIITKPVVNKKEKKVCNVCDFVTIHHQVLVRHMRKHTGERPFACSTCDKKFARKDKLVAHERVHSTIREFKCQLCDYASTNSDGLRKHLRAHSDKRPHKCQICPYRAKSTSHMSVHLRTHTGDCPFFCQVETCGRVFKTSTDLKRHTNSHKHNNSSPTYSCYEDGLKQFSCEHVSKGGKIFNKSSNCYVCQNFSAKEVKRSRGKRGPRVKCSKIHECPHCNAAFVREDSLRSHLNLHRPSTPPLDDGLDLDGSEVGAENEDSITSQSLRLSPPSDSVQRSPTLFYISHSECLQDSLITLDQDGTHCVIDDTFL